MTDIPAQPLTQVDTYSMSVMNSDMHSSATAMLEKIVEKINELVGAVNACCNASIIPLTFSPTAVQSTTMSNSSQAIHTQMSSILGNSFASSNGIPPAIAGSMTAINSQNPISGDSTNLSQITNMSASLSTISRALNTVTTVNNGIASGSGISGVVAPEGVTGNIAGVSTSGVETATLNSAITNISSAQGNINNTSTLISGSNSVANLTVPAISESSVNSTSDALVAQSQMQLNSQVSSLKSQATQMTTLANSLRTQANNLPPENVDQASELLKQADELDFSASSISGQASKLSGLTPLTSDQAKDMATTLLTYNSLTSSIQGKILGQIGSTPL